MTQKTTHYPTVQSDVDFVSLERDVLRFWKEQKVFEASVEGRASENTDGSSNAYVFYDGPPFANGLPHHGHLLTGFVKDAVARYQTMRGHRVERRFGWDCHGLPAEMEAEKQLGVSGRQAIMNYGVDKFNAYCGTSVMKYRDEWEFYVGRQARWVDFENDYKTMDKPYMESVLWAFSELYKKGLIYEGFKVMPYSWAAETVLSSSEIRLDDATREKVDKAVTVAFRLKDIPQFLQRIIDHFKNAKSSIGEVLNPDFNPKNIFLLAWTTTPWTLPSNLALAINRDIQYRAFYNNGNLYIASAQHVRQEHNKSSELQQYYFIGSTYPVSEDGKSSISYIEFQGHHLIDANALYEPLFPYFADNPNAFRVLDGSSFIEEGSGTGVVHMAPGFGEDDMRVCAENGISVVVPVDSEGRYTDAIFDLRFPHPNPLPEGEGTASQKREEKPSPSGRGLGEGINLSLKGLNVIQETSHKLEDEPYSDAQLEKYGLANLRIIQWLKATGHLIKQEDYTHNYPHCWRTDKPIIYKAMSSWFVDVPKIRDRMVELNQQINWIPNHIKDGRFGKWLEGAREWSISRSRFWGCPIPVWRSDNPNNKELYVFGSVAELEAFFGVTVADLHKPAIDQLTKPDPTNPAYTISRVSEVFDCWFESGSMPFAQVHYPFENKEWFEANFPADFIVEYEAQTRGWFYNMMVLSVGLFDAIPFKNCICHGVVLDDKGRKLSKKLKNYVDPKELFETYGSDALRWFMLSSTIMRGNELFLDAEGAFIRDAVRLYIKPLWNAYHFFCLYANADGVSATYDLSSDNLMDRYILAKLKVCVDGVRDALDAYDMPLATTCVSAFCEVLNNWYIRRNRSRFWGTQAGADKVSAYNTLYTVLHTMCRVVAPFLPQVSEAMFAGLVNGGKMDAEHSVHLADYPAELEKFAADSTLMQAMDKVQDICNTAHAIRNEVNIRIRQPLAQLTVYGVTLPLQQDYFASLIADETNVKDVVFSGGFEEVATRKLKIHFPVVGKRLPAKMKDLTAAARAGEWAFTPSGEVDICGETLAVNEFEFTLESTIKTGAAALAAQDGLVVLDTVLTPALRQEGIARDVVRLVQQSRKEAGFDVADRIHLTVQAEGTIAEAVRAYNDYICEQTLTLTLTLGNATTSPHRSTHDMAGEAIALGMQVVDRQARAG